MSIAAERAPGQVLVIGVGNEYRGDDCAGLKVVRALAALPLENAAFLELPGEGTELIEAWRGQERVMVIDASSSGAKSGAITRIDAGKSALPPGFFNYSTHAFGLAEAVETARNLGILPRDFIIYAIEGSAFDQGAPVSQCVEEAVRKLTGLISAEFQPLYSQIR